MGMGNDRHNIISIFSSKDGGIDKGREEKRSKQHSGTDVELLKGSSEPVAANDTMHMGEQIEVAPECRHDDRNSCSGDELKTDEAALFKSSYKQSNEVKKKYFIIIEMLIRNPVFTCSSDRLNHVLENLESACGPVGKEAKTNLEILIKRLIVAHPDDLTCCTRNEKFEDQALDPVEDVVAGSNAGYKTESTASFLDEGPTGQERNKTTDHHVKPDLNKVCKNVHEGSKWRKFHYKDDKTDMLRRPSGLECTEQSRPPVRAESRDCRVKKTSTTSDSQGRATPDMRPTEEDKHAASASPDHEHPEDEAVRKVESTAPSTPMSTERNSCRQDANASPARGGSMVPAKSFNRVSLKTTDNRDESVAETVVSCATGPEAASDSAREDSIVSSGSHSTHPVQGSLDRSVASPTRSETVTSVDTGVADSRERESSASSNALTSTSPDTLQRRQQMCDKLSEHQSASSPSTDLVCTDEMVPTNTPNDTKSDTNICNENKDCEEAQMSISESLTNSTRRDTMMSAPKLDLAEESQSDEESKDSAIAKPGSEFSRSADGCSHHGQAAKSRTMPCDRKKITSNFDMRSFLLRSSEVENELNECKKEQFSEEVSFFDTPQHARIDRKNEKKISSQVAGKVSTREKNEQAYTVVPEILTGMRQQPTSSENHEYALQFIDIDFSERVETFCDLVQECDDDCEKEFLDESDSMQGSPEMDLQHISPWPGDKMSVIASSKSIQQVQRHPTPGPRNQKMRAYANIDCNATTVTTKIVENVITTTKPLEQATRLQSAPCQTVAEGRGADLNEAQTGRVSEVDHAGTEPYLESVSIPPLIPTGAASDHGCEPRAEASKVSTPLSTDLHNSRSACFPQQAPAKQEPESLQAQFDSSGTKEDKTSQDDAAWRHWMRFQTDGNGTRGEEKSLCTEEGPEPFGAAEDGQGADETVAEEQKVSAQNGAETSRENYPASAYDSLGASAHHVPSQEDSITFLDGLQSRTDSPTEQQRISGKRIDDDNQTSVFVRAEENVPAGDPREMQTGEAQTCTGSASKVPDSLSSSDSGGDLYSGTGMGDSRPMGLPFDPVSEIERVKASHGLPPRTTLDPLDSCCFRKAGEQLHVRVFDRAGKGNRIHSLEQRNPDLIIVSLATVRKGKHLSRRTDERTPQFSTADMQDIHADRRSKIQRFSPPVDMRQRFELNSQKRRQDEEDIDVLWQTINNPDRIIPFVVVTLPFFPRDVFPPVSEQMRLESMRLASFHNFPHNHRPSTLRLANTGFFYTGQEDILACHFCGVTFRCDRNSAGVNPYALHRERSPQCPNVRGAANGNLCIQDEQRQALSGGDITGDGSSDIGPLGQVQVSRENLTSSMTTYVAEITKYQSAATADTVQLSEPPTTQSAEARCNSTVGSTNTPLSPGPRTSESGYFSANGPPSEPRSAAEQGQSMTTGDLSRGQNHGLDSAPSTVTTAPPASEASHASRNQTPPRQPPQYGTTTTTEIQTRNSSSPLEITRGPQGPSSSTPQRHQSREGDQHSESNTTSTHLSEPGVEAFGPPGASRDPVVISTAAAGVSSPPLRNEGVVSGTLLQASHQVPRPLPQMVYAVTEPPPTLRQDHQATPPTADSAPNAAVYDPSRALHRNYTDLQRRENSFARWPDTHGQSPEELAVAGFFYTGIGDCVRCHYCGLGLKDWDPEDRAMDEHVRWRSSCGYLQAVLGEYFIAKTLARLGQRGQGDASARSETSESVAAGLASHTTGVGERTATDPRADNSGITTEVDTLMTSQPAQEARAMGFPDDVIRQSIVALLHTRAGRNAVTGRNVVHTILYLRERGQVPEVTEPPAEPSISETNNDNEDDNEDNTSRSTSANSSPQGRTLPRSPAPSVRDKAPAAQSAVSQVGSGQHLQVYQVTMQHGASQNSLQSSGSSSPSSSSFSSSSSGSSSSGSSWSSGDSGFASGSSSEDESSNGRGAQRPSSGPFTRRLPTITEGDVTREDLRRLEQENLELMERRRCKICLDNDISILFLPCGHLVCCGECAPALRRCPMCRKRITGTVHTKLAGLPSSTNPQGPG